MFKIFVVCSEAGVIQDFERVLSRDIDISMNGIAQIPRPGELDRQLGLQRPDAILIASNGVDNLQLIAHLKCHYAKLPVAVLCKDRSADALVSFMRAGVRE